jgi:hypothetical protein
VTQPVIFNPLKSIAVPNAGSMVPRGLTVIIGPNSSGKTQMLKDLQARLLGQSRKLVVCERIDLERPPNLDALLDTLCSTRQIRRKFDQKNRQVIESLMPGLGHNSQSHWTLPFTDVEKFFNTNLDPAHEQVDRFLEHFGRSFLSSLFLDRRLVVTNTVDNFDYENQGPSNELQALYLDKSAKEKLTEEAIRIFGKAIWLDNTRLNKLCLRVSDDGKMPSAEDRLEPEKMRGYRLIEEEGDGFKSYMGTCVTLLLGQRPICLIDEPELCLHPPQAYALGRFIGKYGTSSDHVTFVATHSSHILRGIIEVTKKLEIVRLSRSGSNFSGKKVSHDAIMACIEKPSTKVETILDGLFAEAVSVVESEGDRLVYSTTWERIASEFRHDVHFVSVGGIGGFADTCELYRQLKIPVCIMADLDLLRELDTFERIMKALSSTEEARTALAKCRSIIERIKAMGPLYAEEELRVRLQTIINLDLSWANMSQLADIRRTLSDLSTGLSLTARLKNGVESLRSEPVYPDLNALLGDCRGRGLFLVPAGELEDWVPELTAEAPSKRKKAEWANYAANKLRNAPVGTHDIWAFVRRMAEFQRDTINRLSGYAL